MDVLDLGRELVGHPREGEVVGRDEPQGFALQQAPQDGLRADPPVVRVRAVQHLVEQEEHGTVAVCQVHHLADSLDLRVEVRSALP